MVVYLQSHWTKAVTYNVRITLAKFFFLCIMMMTGAEQDYNMIPEAKVQEADYADEAKGQDHLVPAAEDKTTHGNETELVSSEPDGIASSNVDNQKQDEKG